MKKNETDTFRMEKREKNGRENKGEKVLLRILKNSGFGFLKDDSQVKMQGKKWQQFKQETI